MIKTLLSLGSNVNAVDTLMKSPLLYAIEKPNGVEIAELLLGK